MAQPAPHPPPKTEPGDAVSKPPEPHGEVVGEAASAAPPALAGEPPEAAHGPAGHGAEGAHGAAEAAGGLPQFDFGAWPGQIFWLLIVFGVLYFVLSRALLPRIGAVIEDRRDKIADDLDEAQRLRRQAEDALRAYEEALADARAKAHAIAGDIRAKLAQDTAERAKALEGELAKRAEEADAGIRARAAQALAQVDAVAADAAGAIAEKLSGKAVAAEAAKAAVAAVAATRS